MLLKVGRHIRPAPHFKLIIGREEGENRYLEGYRNTFISLEPKSHRGPMTLIDGSPTDTDIELAAAIAARYSQGRDTAAVELELRFPDGGARLISVTPHPQDDIADTWLV